MAQGKHAPNAHCNHQGGGSGMIDENYAPSRVGYPCAAMIRFRPDMVNESRIEVYPTDQWGLLGDYDGPENTTLHWMLTRSAAGNPVEQGT